MITCKQASELISQSLDHPLSWSKRMQLRLHLLICRPCNRFKLQLNLLRTGLQRIRTNLEQDYSIRLSLDAKARITRAIESNPQ